jgi:hypothetical protein
VEWTSSDHARTFTGPTLVTGGLNSQAALALAARPLVDPADPSRIEQFYETAGVEGIRRLLTDAGPSEFPFSQLWQASSVDGGRTWTNRRVVDVRTAFGSPAGTLGHLLPAAAIDRSGRAYVVLSVRRGTSEATHLYLLRSTTAGAWSSPQRIDRGYPSNVYPAAAVGARGRLYVSWYASGAASFTAADARWHEMVATARDGLAAAPRFVIRRVGPVAHVGPIEQAGAVGFDLGENWNLRDFQSIVVDSCGQPHAMWAADYRNGGRVLTATPAGGCR